MMGQSKEQLQSKEREYKLLQEDITQVRYHLFLW